MSEVITITGVEEVLNRLQAMGRDVEKDLEGALRDVAGETMTDAKRRTPFRYGALRGSGTVGQVVMGPGYNGEVELGFGGPAAPYAVYVHERLHAHHPIGEAKFLEKAIKAMKPRFLTRIVARLKARLAT